MSLGKKVLNLIRQSDAMQLDATETMFVEKELNKLESTIYEEEFPMLQYREILPIEVTNEPWEKTISYKMKTIIGKAKIITNYADDLPNVTRFVKEFFRKVIAIGDSFTYDWEEVEAAAKNGMSLTNEGAMNCREAIEQKTDDIMLIGDDKAGIEGFFDLTGTQTYTVPADGTGSSKLWSVKTPLLIVRDVNGLIQTIPNNTNNTEFANMVLIPYNRYSVIATTPMSADNNTTILEFLKAANPDVTFMSANKLKGVAASGERMIAYRKDMRKVQGNITYAISQKNIVAKPLSFIVPYVQKVAGTIARYPKSICYGDGI